MYCEFGYKKAGQIQALGATVDANIRSEENEKLWSPSDVKLGELFHTATKTAYPERRTFFNIRKNFLAVKVHRPSQEERDSEHIRNFDWWAANQGVDIVKTPQGVIYRIKR